ncbi:ATP-binding protein [Marinomonas balearica]|uniref:ATPase family protein associated with various cellular activities (AAA) n=1 Tax=Marinomonas balearica TaxID=491947 RepID=A0A4R6M5Q0_9GAMM|nr:AAA family ATPase [Marinomonas balearica]TDO96678.1 ATPase family protein associated with various cellular activities (AAA) [Marinomonas balearica]
MSMEIAQMEAEQALAAACYRLGETLNDAQATKTDVLSARDTHFDRLDALTDQTKWQLLQESFALSNHAVSLLAIVYLFQLEPDLLAVYSKLSWYEQGGGISAKRALYLSVDEYSDETPSDFPMLVMPSSELVKAQLLICANPVTPMVQSLMVSEPLFEYITTQRNVDHFARENVIDGYLNRVIDAASPATAAMYEGEFVVPSALLNIVEIDQQEETLAFVHNLTLNLKQQGLQLGDLWLVRTPITNPDAAAQLQKAILKAQLENMPAIQAVFWPSLISDCVTSSSLRSLAEYLIKTLHIIVFCNPLEESESSEQTLWVKEWESKHAYYYRPLPNQERKMAAWRELCVAEGCPNALTESEISQLVERYPLVSYQMLSAFEKVQKESTDGISYKSLQQTCLYSVDSKTKGLARFSLPRITMKDMVLKKEVTEQLDEIMARMRFRKEMTKESVTFLSGTQALFWGPPGTGKTMAAEAIAGELGLPLYKVNLSNVASKWIGETEKHLSKLFDQAERQQAVLLFDEADAIFAKRSEVESSQDKNANMGVSYLLQRMESYHGILLLSTNFKANIDDAFLRRFTTVTEFSLPDKATRKTLWNNVWQGSLKLTNAIDLNSLSADFELSPSQIRNVAERACLLALMDQKTEIDQVILAKALRREFDKQSAGFLTSKRISDWLK